MSTAHRILSALVKERLLQPRPRPKADIDKIASE